MSKSGRGFQGIDHHHTQSAALMKIIPNSQDLSKITYQQQSNDTTNILNHSSLVPDSHSKRERRNQQQILHMMKYNQ